MARLDEKDRAFLRNVTTSAVVPVSSATSIDELLLDPASLEQRKTLYFDESLKVLVLLDFPPCSEDILKSYLSRLELRLDAWAISTQIGSERSPVETGPMRDLIASQIVTTSEDPFTAVKQGEDDSELRILVAWEVTVTLGRPRLRSAEQSVVFLPIASILDPEAIQDGRDYLEPFTIPEFGMFGVFDDDSRDSNSFSRAQGFSGTPSVPAKDSKFRIKHQASDPIRAYAIVMPRLRYNKINASRPKPTMIASLDLDFIPFIHISGTIESINITMANGTVTPLMPNFLPMPYRSKDCTTFFYDLQSSHQSNSPTPAEAPSPLTPSSIASLNLDILSMTVHITVDLTPTGTTNIKMSWTTNVDFSLALNPAFGAPAQPLQRPNRPTSLNFAPYPDPNKGPQQSRDRTSSVRAASTSLQHQIIPQSIPRQPLTSILSVSFVAPTHPVYVGKPFTWRVLIVNNSSRVAKLAILPLPRIQRPANASQHFAKRHAPKASNASIPPGAYRHTRNAPSTAKAVVEEQILYALHHSAGGVAGAAPSDTDVVSLTVEVRIGPLGVGQCHETEIKFVTWKKGVFNVDAVRVVDLTRDSEGMASIGLINDIRELPEIVVEEEAEHEEGNIN